MCDRNNHRKLIHFSLTAATNAKIGKKHGSLRVVAGKLRGNQEMAGGWRIKAYYANLDSPSSNIPRPLGVAQFTYHWSILYGVKTKQAAFTKRLVT
jgi:hypothetical protein